MKVAAYQAPFLSSGSAEALPHIRRQIDHCESAGVSILCCPEAIIGGLADYAASPAEIAIDIPKLVRVLAPIASDTVTTIVGFTEAVGPGILFNSAALFHQGSVIGVYRKQHPAIRHSIYTAGDELPVFHVNDLCFGILICNDSNFPGLARGLASQGAKAIFIPTDSALPLERADVSGDARDIDIAIAKENKVWVIRADVAGRADRRISYGSSVIVDPTGKVRRFGKRLCEDLMVQDITICPVRS